MAVAAVPAEIHGIIRRHGNRWIAIARGAARYGMDCPGEAVIAGRNHRSISVAAIFVGNIGGAIGPNFYMSMEAAAIRQGIDRHSGAVSEAAVQADSAGGVNHILRAVINGVLISDRRGQLRNQAGSERATANCLMIDSRRNTATHSGRVACSVIVSEGRKTARTCKLRYEGTASGGISKHDWVKR